MHVMAEKVVLSAVRPEKDAKKAVVLDHGFLFLTIPYRIRRYFTRETYSPERVSTRITSPI